MNIKKHISLFLALTFLFSNLGMAFTVHFCDGKFESITANGFEKNSNPEIDCCGEIEKESNCCDNKTIKVDNTIDKQSITNFNYTFPVAILPEETTLVFPVAKVTTSQKNNPIVTVQANAPPLYKLYCSLIFYS